MYGIASGGQGRMQLMYSLGEDKDSDKLLIQKLIENLRGGENVPHL